MFTESITLNDDGSHATETDTRYDSTGVLYSQTMVAWTYDGEGRLTDEKLTILDDGTGGTSNADGNAPVPYDHTFDYDLNGNRQHEYSVDTYGNKTTLDTYYYNPDDQLTGDAGTDYGYGYTYDAAGNLATSTYNVGTDPNVTTYSYDLRNP